MIRVEVTAVIGQPRTFADPPQSPATASAIAEKALNDAGFTVVRIDAEVNE